MLVAASGWWVGSIILVIIWIAIAFWPARVAARKGHSFFLYFLFSLIFLPSGSDRGVHGSRSNQASHGLNLQRGQVQTKTRPGAATPRQGLFPHSYGVWPVKRAGVIRPAVRGVRFGEGSASAVVDVCVATHMRGLVPHDRVCEMRSGAVLWRRAWPAGAAHSVLSGRSSRRCAGALSSPSR